MSALTSASCRYLCQIVSSVLLFVVAIIFASAAVSPARAQTFTTLHTFTNNPDGASPFGGLVADRSGNFYGTTEYGGTLGGGTVFELSPPTAGGSDWTETAIWNFGGGPSGSVPAYPLAMDSEGNLYGETQLGGNPACGCGAVFLLARPKMLGGSWTERAIYVPASGSTPLLYGGLIVDSTGAVYGTEFYGGKFNQGLAFKLAPTANGQFEETILYNFGAASTDAVLPYGPLTIDSNGNLYGLSYLGGANNYGTVYKLTPPASGTGPWTNSILYSFTNGSLGCFPAGNVILDKSGRLYGQTVGCGVSNGVIFQLTPPAGAGPWVESVLYTFNSTDGGGGYSYLSFDAKANAIYGTSFFSGGDGVVFQLTSSGVGGWTDTVLHAFTGGADGSGPNGPLVWDANGVLYGTTYSSDGAFGTAFSIAP